MHHHRRPAFLTLLCWLMVLSGFVEIPLVIGFVIATVPERTAMGADWADNALIVTSVFGMGLAPLAGFYMLKAKNWARWIAVTLVILDLATAIWLITEGHDYPMKTLVRDAIRVPMVLCSVFTPSANRYFASGRSRRRRADGFGFEDEEE